MKKLLGILGLCWTISAAHAGSSPGLQTGQVPTASEWNSYFAAKQDDLGFTPLPASGGFLTGPLITIGATPTVSGFTVTPGTAPTTPKNGDFWVTATGAFVQVGGMTISLTGTSSGGSFGATAPLSVSTPAGVVTYALTGNVPVGNLGGGTGATATTFWRGDGTWTQVGAANLTGNLPVGNLAGGTGASATTFWRGDGTWTQPNAGNLTGNLPVTNLNSGSGASTTTFWRGDGTWAAPTAAAFAATAPLAVTMPAGVVTYALTGNVAVGNLGGGTGASATTFWRGDGSWASPNAGNLTGNLPVNNLNSGTGASTTTFWRGDGTWASLPASNIFAANAPLSVATAGGTTTYSLGNVPVTNLNSGTGASSTTFWRGDGSWANPGINSSGTAGQLAYYATVGTTLSPTLNVGITSGANSKGLIVNSTATTIDTVVTYTDGTNVAYTGFLVSSGFACPTGTWTVFASGCRFEVDTGGNIYAPGLNSVTTAQAGTVCFAIGGRFTYDPSAGCLTSLEELKDILGPITSALEEVLALKPFWFIPKDRPPGSDLAEQPGLGAHQVASVDERLVGRDANGDLRGVRYMELTAVLAAAIQELNAKVDALLKR